MCGNPGIKKSLISDFRLKPEKVASLSVLLSKVIKEALMTEQKKIDFFSNQICCSL